MTEQFYRDSFIAGHKALFEDGSNPRLLQILQANFPEMKTAYVIEWIPDQGEDFYVVLLSEKIDTAISDKTGCGSGFSGKGFE